GLDAVGRRCLRVASCQWFAELERGVSTAVGCDLDGQVAAIGNPKGLDTSLSRGLIARKRNNNGHAYIQTDAAISSGSSGGGLIDTAGNLVGVTTFKVSSGESLNFAIAIDEFCR
ncbi:MAG TPA: trypsin-like peptidase domain-containing protein, partial [Halioglobus sp.]